MPKTLHAGSIALLSLMMPLQGLASAQDTVICGHTGPAFCSAFEEGSLAVWDAVNGVTAPTIVADQGPFARAGNHVLRLFVPPGTGSTNVIKTFPGSQKIYARWYQRWEAGYDFTAPQHGSGLHAGYRWDYGRSGSRPNGTDWFSTWLEPVTGSGNTGRLNLYSYYRGMYMDCANPIGSCWGDLLPCMIGPNYCTKPPIRTPPPLPPVMQANRWYCLEVMLDGGTPTPSQAGATGAQDFWVDGVPYGPWTGLWHRTTATGMNVNLLTLSTHYHNTHANVGVRYDDVVVSTTRVGCAASSAAPGAPTNLQDHSLTRAARDSAAVRLTDL